MPRRHLLCTSSLLVTLTCATAQAGAHVTSASTMAFRAFPEAETVRKIERRVDRAARAQIEQRLPFRVHFEELGTHELYVAFRGQAPVGLLYVRSEESDWGLAEIGWAMSLDGEVLGFRFASSRSSRADEVASSPFAERLVGLDFAALVALHEQLETKPAPSGESSSRLDSLSRTVLRSALKATVVTDVVWNDEVKKLADLAMLYEEFPGAADGRRYIADLTPRRDAPRQLTSLRLMEARGRGGFALGSVARAEVRYRGQTVQLRWVLDQRNTVMRVRPCTSWADEELRRACSALHGRRLDDPDLSDTRLAAAARELAAELAQPRVRGRRQ